MIFEELKELGLPCYPDNDGGLWYWDPKTGMAEKVKES